MAVEEKELETLEAEGEPEREPEAAPEDEASSDKTPPEQDAGEKEKPEPPVEKKPYTAEELQELLTSDGEIDDTKLSPEGQLIKKSFQRGFNKKFEQLAAEKKAFKAGTQPEDPKEAYFRQYLTDTPNTVKEINDAILTAKIQVRELKVNGEFEKADAEEIKIARLEGLREEFAVKKQAITEQGTNMSQFNDAVIKAIPDIDEIRDLLTRFAQEELGYTEDELFRLTNPESGIAVSTAVRNIATIARSFKQANAAKTVSKKVKKPSPLPLERGGSGGREEPLTNKNLNDMSYKEYEAYREKQELRR